MSPDPASIARFVLGRGRFASVTRLPLSDVDEKRLASARQAFSELVARGSSTVPVSLPEGQEGRLGLGLPPSGLAPEAISEWVRASKEEIRKAWEALDVTSRRLRRSAFFVATSTKTHLCWVVPDTSGNDIARAGLYGAITGSAFTPAAMQQARGFEPRLASLPPYDPTTQDMCDEVFAAAPAFMRTEPLDGASAEFVDYFAIAILQEQNSSLH